MYERPKFLKAGDSALIIELGNEINERCNEKVVALAKELKSVEGVLEIVPAYRSLLVYYDPSIIEFDDLKDKSEERLKRTKASIAKGKTFEVPVCYGGEFGPDLGFVARHNGLSDEEVIEIHCSGDYRVYMLGFLPGFPYLGGMDERIAALRLEKPRTKIAAGSVGIAGKQTGIYPVESPGGWRIIGRTPLSLYNPEAEDPVPIRAGDTIRFKRISEKEFLERAK
ncbi:MAG: 5-oxoprolinase subunit PxpB [Candidatus Thermoplasmatota archaeon]|nr:5-oxoprolinase subunit PxpB [Candidatus Thermoplasmatota archaeon]